MKDALALGGEEGRDKLRKAAVRGKYPLQPRISEWGNPSRATVTPRARRGGPTRGTETSHYPEEKKETSIARVVASESAGAQTRSVATHFGGCRIRR